MITSGSPRLLRIALWIWLGLQGLILIGILATHGPGMEPDLRMLSGAAIVLASFPLSIGALWAALAGLEHFGVQAHLTNSLVTWASCFLAGATQLWLLAWLFRRFRQQREA